MTRIYLRLIWDRLRASYWFVPAEGQASSSIVWDQERVSRRSAELAARLQGSIPAVRSAPAHTGGAGPVHS